MQPIFNTKPDTSQTFFRSFPIDQRPVWNLIASLFIAFLNLISSVTKLAQCTEEQCKMILQNDSSDGNPSRFKRSR